MIRPKVPQTPPVFAAQAFSRLIALLARLQFRLLPAPAVLMQLSSGGMLISRSLYVVAELGIADLLKAGPQSVEYLARMSQTDAPTLYRILRALASVGIFAETRQGTFRLTRLAKYLLSDQQGTMRSWVRYAGADWHHELWGAVVASVRNGRSTYENVHGMRFFEWLELHPEAGQLFDEAMASTTTMTNPVIATAYDFSGVGTLMDVAGGRGSMLAAIMRANPALRGILFDLPQVVAGAQGEPALNESSIATRLDFASGSFFEAVPAGADAYMLKSILHDWQDAEAESILRNVRSAIAPGGKLLLVEMVIAPGNDPFIGKLLDLAMLTQTGGKERTEDEFRRLLAAADFTLRRVIRTASPFSIIEADPR